MNTLTFLLSTVIELYTMVLLLRQNVPPAC